MKKWCLTCFLLFLFLFFSVVTDTAASGDKIRAKNIGTMEPGERDRVPVFDQRPPYEWPTSSPEAQGMDSMLVENAIREVGLQSYVRSILVIRNGYLVGERYFQGQQPTDAVSFRWAHGVLNALVGIALKENYLQSIDQKMMDFFPEYAHAELDPRKYDITIRHLLEMSTAFIFEERSETAWNNWLSSSNWMQHAIDLQLTANPGESFIFNSPQPHIISGILTKATGMSTLAFAEKYLFDPLGISIRGWEQDPQGIYKGGWGMSFTPRDLARLGYLYLNNGQVDGKQILTPEWVQESIQKYHSLVRTRPFENTDIEDWGYGYYWHSGVVLGHPLYFQVGYGGQLILVMPDMNMIVVVTADPDVTWDGHEIDFREIYYTLIRFIPGVVWGDHEPPPYAPADINGERFIVRSLTQLQFLDKITWQSNPQNAGANIIGYKIYRYSDEDDYYTWMAPLRIKFVEEVSASTFEFIYRDHIFSNFTPLNTYGVTAVSADGKESLAAVVIPKESQ